MSVYNFREGPSYTAATREEMFTAAMDMPMNFGATFWDQAKGGALESFGVGTAIRGAAIPPGETSQLGTMEQISRTAQTIMPGGAIAAIGGAIQRLTSEPSPVLSEDAYKSSPFFRKEVPWDASMTEDRAAALASWHDAKAVRQYFATKRPITAFIGNVAGQAVDPINYIPVVGPTVQAAAAARVGRVIGTAATASADAALNTAIAGIATAGQRAQFGDDVSWQATISEIATAALIGAAFGGIAGGLDARRASRVEAAARERLSTLQTTQEARIALNEGIDALAKGEDINLSPNATAGIDRVSARQAVALPVELPSAPLTAQNVGVQLNSQLSFQSIPDDIIAERVVPVRDLIRDGDQQTSPFILPDGRIVSTFGDHLDFVERLGETRIAEAQMKYGIVRFHYGDGADGRVLDFSVAEGQEMTPKQAAVVQRVANARSRGQLANTRIIMETYSPESGALVATKQVARIDELLPRAAIEPAEVSRDAFRFSTPVTERPEFQKWFEGSQAIDDSGSPIVLYHGGKSNIESFRPNDSGLIYMTSDPELASDYAVARSANGSVYPVYASVKNPLVVDRALDLTSQKMLVARAREEGRDGIILKNADDSITGMTQRGTSTVVIAFEPSQIKSRFNVGAFSRADPRIIDTSPPRPEPIPAGRAEAEKTLTRPDDYAALKAQYRVDPETGDFLESAEIDQLRAEGRLTDEDIAALDAAQAELDNGTAYGDALKAAVACII